MGDIKINDPQTLISQSENLLQYAQNILRIVEDLKGHASSIGNAWQSDTLDKETYLSAINSSLNKMETLAAVIRATGNKLIYYARQQIANANNSSN